MTPILIATSPCPEGNYVTLVYSDHSILYLRTGDFTRLSLRDQLQDFPLVQSLAVK